MNTMLSITSLASYIKFLSIIEDRLLISLEGQSIKACANLEFYPFFNFFDWRSPVTIAGFDVWWMDREKLDGLCKDFFDSPRNCELALLRIKPLSRTECLTLPHLHNTGYTLIKPLSKQFELAEPRTKLLCSLPDPAIILPPHRGNVFLHERTLEADIPMLISPGTVHLFSTPYGAETFILSLADPAFKDQNGNIDLTPIDLKQCYFLSNERDVLQLTL